MDFVEVILWILNKYFSSITFSKKLSKFAGITFEPTWTPSEPLTKALCRHRFLIDLVQTQSKPLMLPLACDALFYAVYISIPHHEVLSCKSAAVSQISLFRCSPVFYAAAPLEAIEMSQSTFWKQNIIDAPRITRFITLRLLLIIMLKFQVCFVSSLWWEYALVISAVISFCVQLLVTFITWIIECLRVR